MSGAGGIGLSEEGSTNWKGMAFLIWIIVIVLLVIIASTGLISCLVPFTVFVVPGVIVLTYGIVQALRTLK